MRWRTRAANREGGLITVHREHIPGGQGRRLQQPAVCMCVCVCVCVWLSVCVLIHIGHFPLSQSSNQCHGLGLTSSVHTYGSGGDDRLLSLSLSPCLSRSLSPSLSLSPPLSISVSFPLSLSPLSISLSLSLSLSDF